MGGCSSGCSTPLVGRLYLLLHGNIPPPICVQFCLLVKLFHLPHIHHHLLIIRSWCHALAINSTEGERSKGGRKDWRWELSFNILRWATSSISTLSSRYDQHYDHHYDYDQHHHREHNNWQYLRCVGTAQSTNPWIWEQLPRGKMMSQRANKLHRPFLANSIYCSDPISKLSKNCSKTWINSCRHQNLCTMTYLWKNGHYTAHRAVVRSVSSY